MDGLAHLSVDVVARQLALEAEAVDAGQARVREMIAKARSQGEEADTRYGRRATSVFLEDLAAAIEATKQTDSSTGGAGNRRAHAAYLGLLPAETVAYVTLREIINTLTQAVTLQKAANRVASAIENEYRAKLLEEASPQDYSKMTKKMETRTRRNVEYASKRIEAGLKRTEKVEAKWPVSDKIHLGVLLIGLVVEKTGLVKTRREARSANDTPTVLLPTETTLEWIRGEEARALMSATFLWPMLCPPRQWAAGDGGGYLSPRMRLRLVKTRNKAYLEEIENLDMSRVHAAADASHVQIRQASGFTIGVQLFGDSNGCEDSDLHLGRLIDNKVGLDLRTGTSIGWCNSLRFYGGHFACQSTTNMTLDRFGVRLSRADGAYTLHNALRFYGPSFELQRGAGTEASPSRTAIPFLVEVDAVASVTWNTTTPAANATAYTSVTTAFANAYPGDIAEAAWSAASTLRLSAQVSATQGVTLYCHNHSAAALSSLSSGPINIRVTKRRA
ncbi:hypothetical protein RQ831_16175 [Roseomonas gilardii]|uniref:DNA-directed RNA polymerase N-terminal domain-containing protein n=1 Tax=Roseomonas gilardii TaxID=257708 RepID=A0ABU3MIQ7_9PROT|nr:hypothetical protein [Roseomonas gilardii]MDT8332595.1 hypothetical protein [Roseomonas gilardii]